MTILNQIFFNNFWPLDSFELALQYITIFVPCGSFEHRQHHSNHADEEKKPIGASEAQNQSRKRAAKNKSPEDLVDSRAAAAASKKARQKRIPRDMLPGDLVASKATAAAAEK